MGGGSSDESGVRVLDKDEAPRNISYKHKKIFKKVITKIIIIPKQR